VKFLNTLLPGSDESWTMQGIGWPQTRAVAIPIVENNLTI
jgi:hypothetical protein